MFIGRIATDEKDCRRGCDVAEAGRFAGVLGECAGKGCVVGGALVVDVVGAENSTREFLQQVVFFVGGAIGADDGNGVAAARVANFFELAGRKAECMFPSGGFAFACGISNERLRQAVFTVDKIEAKAAFGAEKVAVDAALVAVVSANDVGALVGLVA